MCSLCISVFLHSVGLGNCLASVDVCDKLEQDLNLNSEPYRVWCAVMHLYFVFKIILIYNYYNSHDQLKPICKYSLYCEMIFCLIGW